MNEALRRARRSKLLNQAEVAKVLNVYPTTISKWERGWQNRGNT